LVEVQEAQRSQLAQARGKRVDPVPEGPAGVGAEGQGNEPRSVPRLETELPRLQYAIAIVVVEGRGRFREAVELDDVLQHREVARVEGVRAARQSLFVGSNHGTLELVPQRGL